VSDKRSRPSTPSQRAGRTPEAGRRQAKRRRAVQQSVRRFSALLPGFEAPRLAAPDLGLRRLGLAGLGFSGLHWSKALSLLLLAGVVTALAWLHSGAQWFVYRESTAISGQHLLSADDIYAAAGVENWNVLWLRRDEIRRRLLAEPWVADADVSVRLPAAVEIAVRERPAVAVWATGEGEYWVAATGALHPVAEETSAAAARAPRLVDPLGQAGLETGEGKISVDIQAVAGALSLIQRMPGLAEVRYSAEVGLNFSLPESGLWVYWGDGERVDEKLDSVALGRKLVQSGEAAGAVLDVRNPGKPFVR
jgi:cell division protein FtsQ